MRHAIIVASALAGCVEPLGGLDGLPEDAVVGMKAVEEGVLADGVVETTWEVPVGLGEYDRIGLHRLVVGEPSGPAVFLVHGALQTFRAFADGESSLAVYLAQHGYDVWGIDVRGSLVPPEETDLAFMEPWDMGTHVGDVRKALGIARLVRTAQGAGSDPIVLLGFSRGLAVSYSVVAAEAALPEARRHVSALVALDMRLTSAEGADRVRTCARYEAIEAARAAGEFHNSSGALPMIGALALAAPQATSPLFPPFTNEQVATASETAPWICQMLAGPADPRCALPVTPWNHHNAGLFVPSGIPGVYFPYAFAFADKGRVFQRMTQGAAWEDNGTTLDMVGMQCPDLADPPWDDHFGDVTVPILYLGARGGFGTQGNATAMSFTSAEVTLALADPPTAPCPWPDPRACAFGHGDMLYAANAPEVVWEPVLDWLETH